MVVVVGGESPKDIYIHNMVGYGLKISFIVES